MTFETPILLIAFNRPDHTAKVFERIREIQPRQLFVAVDGPRPTHSEDEAKCAAVKQFVLERTDWNCDLQTLFRDTNLGCGNAVSSAINWMFENVEEAIILEDDCLPDITFFNFCAMLLNRYKTDKRIMHIGGSNFQNKHDRRNEYYFSSYAHIWGWATWKRAWQHFSLDVSRYNPAMISSALSIYNKSSKEKKFWINCYSSLLQKKIDTWDYQWSFTVWANGGLSIIPPVNLVSNIGFDAEATHTSVLHENLLKKSFPLTHINHPPTIEINYDADRYTFNHCYSPKETLTSISRQFISKNLLRPWREISFRLRQNFTDLR